MAEYDNSNTGVLFKNDRKESEKDADYTGSLNVGGQGNVVERLHPHQQEGDEIHLCESKGEEVP